jgi:hypothetical protein
MRCQFHALGASCWLSRVGPLPPYLGKCLGIYFCRLTGSCSALFGRMGRAERTAVKQIANGTE